MRIRRFNTLIGLLLWGLCDLAQAGLIDRGNEWELRGTKVPWANHVIAAPPLTSAGLRQQPGKFP